MRNSKPTKKEIIFLFAIILLLLFGAFFFAYKIFLDKNALTSLSQATAKIFKPLSKNDNESIDQDPNNPNATFQNQKFAYSIVYPKTWYLNSDDANNDLKSDPTSSDTQVTSGGQVFLSNYKNIGDYDPTTKPDDFHLLSLSVYEAKGKTSDQLASLLGFEDQAISNKRSFAGKNISGSEYIGAGIDEPNPHVGIIFQSGSRFYVFTLTFVGGDVDAATLMENVASSFSLK